MYSDAQAARGETEYVAHCASCHRDDLSEYQGVLKGDRFMNDYREGTLYRLFDKMKTTMPRNAAGSLSDHEYVDILSFVLKSNDFPVGPEELTSEDLQEVLVVGRDGSEPVPNYSLVQVVGCLVHNEGDATWVLTRAADPVRAPQSQPSGGERTVHGEAAWSGHRRADVIASARSCPASRPQSGRAGISHQTAGGEPHQHHRDRDGRT